MYQNRVGPLIKVLCNVAEVRGNDKLFKRPLNMTFITIYFWNNLKRLEIKLLSAGKPHSSFSARELVPYHRVRPYTIYHRVYTT